jgi:hypothetical protein
MHQEEMGCTHRREDPELFGGHVSQVGNIKFHRSTQGSTRLAITSRHSDPSDSDFVPVRYGVFHKALDTQRAPPANLRRQPRPVHLQLASGMRR